jgi:CheY-like chemotaxis protein/signal transduction histidine kinase
MGEDGRFLPEDAASGSVDPAVRAAKRSLTAGRPDASLAADAVGRRGRRMSQLRSAREAQVREQLATLHDGERLASELGSLLRHELRTPLSAILALSELLLGHTDGPLTEEQERQVDYIHDAAQALLRLVDDLLQLASLEVGNATPELSSFSVAELFEELRGMLPPPEGDLEPVLFDDPGLLPPLRSDRRKLAQALRALLANAAQRSERGQARLSAALDESGQVVFCVSESSIQESAEEAAPPRAGSTLDVPLAFCLAELLGARLTFESEPDGGGSRFLFAIGATGAAGSEPQAEARSAPQPSQQSARLLVIDDDEADRYLIARSLRKLGYEVRTATDGAAGIEAARNDPPDALVVDLRMPGIDGLDVLEQLRCDPTTRDLPIVVHTGLGPESLEALRLSESKIRFVDKSHVGSDRLAAALAELLAKRPAQ